MSEYARTFANQAVSITIPMLPTSNGLLENDQWEEMKGDLQISPISRATSWVTRLARPSFLTRSSNSFKDEPIRRTAYLDGLRGFAAFLVYWQHHQSWARYSIRADKIFENSFGYESRYYFATLPGIRLLFTGGHFAVTVFFVISGYVLVAKPLSLIHAGEQAKLADNLASALFRRYLRLHIPIFVTTFLYMTTWHAFGVWTAIPEHQRNYRDEIWNFYAEFKNFSFVFGSERQPIFSYDVHLWSIPVEFKGSLIVYTAALAFSRCSRNWRLICEAGLLYYFTYIADGWFGSLFMGGMILCDLDLLASNDDLPAFLTRLEPYKKTAFYTLFVISIYLGGVPSSTDKLYDLQDGQFGWYYLSLLKPQAVYDYKWFYLLFASVFLVASIPRIPWLKAFFETRFNQYLGRISFALYMVHGPVLWTLADRLYVAVGWAREEHVMGIPQWISVFPISKAGPLGLELSFLLPHIVILPFTLWLAEVVTKVIDEPSVKFSQWLYKKTMGSSLKL